MCAGNTLPGETYITVTPGTSPPKRKTKNVKNSEADCIVCDEPILEPSENCEGDEAVFCEGDCQGWIHRKCAGVTRSAFDKLGESDVQYLCSQCMLASQNREICKLANIIKDLNASIIPLTETITLLQSSANITSTMQQTASEQTTINTSNNPPEARVQPANLSNMKARPTDRNLNVALLKQRCSVTPRQRCLWNTYTFKSVHIHPGVLYYAYNVIGL